MCIRDRNLAGDSTFALLLEAQERGYDIDMYTPDMLTLNDGILSTKAQQIKAYHSPDRIEELNHPRSVLLNEYDIVLMRQDPPFDMGYITNTHLLDLVASETLIVNDPFWVRNFPEKLLVLKFPDLIPDTLISRDLEEIKEFKREFKDIIVKPLYGNGGAGIFRLKEDDKNLTSLHELFSKLSSEPLIAQAFLPDVRNGDKRIILVDGSPVGAINRVPKAGEIRSNMHVGGKAEPAKLSQRDREICSAIGPTLKSKGQIFVGIDIIGCLLYTSPSPRD